MAGIAVQKSARGGIQNAAEEGDEFIGGDAFAEHAVDDGAYARGAIHLANGCAQAGLHVGHQQSGRNTFAGDVCNTHGQPVFPELQHIEVISADRAGGLPRAGHLESRQLGNHLGNRDSWISRARCNSSSWTSSRAAPSWTMP